MLLAVCNQSGVAINRTGVLQSPTDTEHDRSQIGAVVLPQKRKQAANDDAGLGTASTCVRAKRLSVSGGDVQSALGVGGVRLSPVPRGNTHGEAFSHVNSGTSLIEETKNL